VLEPPRPCLRLDAPEPAEERPVPELTPAAEAALDAGEDAVDVRRGEGPLGRRQPERGRPVELPAPLVVIGDGGRVGAADLLSIA
jgi:hypothetical protein